MQLSGKQKLLFVVAEDVYFCSHRLDLAKSARDAGFEVHLATRKSTQSLLIENEGIKVHPIEFDRKGMNPFQEKETIKSLKKIFEDVKPDIIHNVALKPVLYGTLAALGLSKKPKMIQLITGLGFLFTSQKPHIKFLANAVLLTFRLLWKKFQTEVILQNKDDEALFLKKKLISPAHLHLILGSGVNTKAYPFSKEPEGKPIALFVGRLLKDKGIFELIDAARLLKIEQIPVEIHVIGTPDLQNPSSTSIEEISTWVKEGLITWHGHQSDIASFWEQSHIAVLPSYREGLPKSMLEAASSGRPIVSTDVPGCREICISHLNGILVPAKDPIALAKAIKELALSKDLRQKMGIESRKLVEEKFSIETINQQTLSLYN